MDDSAVVLSRADRDEIMKAVAAIQHLLKAIVDHPKPPALSLYAIGMQLNIIQAKVGKVPLTSPN